MNKKHKMVEDYLRRILKTIVGEDKQTSIKIVPMKSEARLHVVRVRGPEAMKKSMKENFPYADQPDYLILVNEKFINDILQIYPDDLNRELSRMIFK